MAAFVLAVYLCQFLLLQVVVKRRAVATWRTSAVEAAISTAILVGVLVFWWRQQTPSFSKAQQKRTVAELRNTANALREYRRLHGGFPTGNVFEMAKTLERENLMERVPLVDGWKANLDYQGSNSGFVLRSAGADGELSRAYVVGAFEPTDYDQDIVVTEVAFTRWPQRQGRERNK